MEKNGVSFGKIKKGKTVRDCEIFAGSGNSEMKNYLTKGKALFYTLLMKRQKMLKTEIIALRIAPEIKKALERVAEEDARSVSSLIEKLIRDYLKKKGIDWRKSSER